MCNRLIYLNLIMILARKFDYFDQATMMELQTQLFFSTQNSQHDFIDYSRRAIKFKASVRLFMQY